MTARESASRPRPVVGRHEGEPVTHDCPGTSPYAFTGGTIRQATVKQDWKTVVADAPAFVT
ncbi:hypothetical protein [Solirubrobacter soli]|uniref:hypothetical protein n=1 Tax=Solirubrobacter soli TaxID=363832 RepID=UPI0003F5D434|nr:hypothetical protein [Solirubrobacter soli]